MSARRSNRGGKRRHGGGGGEAESEERWLLTYADMITLLMALFMVLFSITSVNKAKLEVLSKTLQDAFSGKVLPGGESIQSTGADPKSVSAPTAAPNIPAITTLVSSTSATSSAAARAKEQEDFRRLKEQIDSYARQKGVQDKVQSVIAQRGLVIRLLTDRVLFDSGADPRLALPDELGALDRPRIARRALPDRRRRGAPAPLGRGLRIASSDR
jgi:chemotaxis protein MotB